MKIQVFLAMFLVFGTTTCLLAQKKGLSNETTVVFVVNEKSNTITGIELFDRDKSKSIIKSHPDSKFYFGKLTGTYSLTDHGLSPDKRSSLVMYTNNKELPKNFFSGDVFFPGDTWNVFFPGDTWNVFSPSDAFQPKSRLKVNDSNLTVVEKSKTQLVFRTE